MKKKRVVKHYPSQIDQMVADQWKAFRQKHNEVSRQVVFPPNYRTGIKTGNQLHRMKRVGGLKAFVELELVRRWGALANWTVSGPGVHAWVLRSNWVADCPDCSENLPVEPGLGFYCPNCQNVKNGCQARPVIWPHPNTRRAIELILSQRANPDTRNWLVTESVPDLKAQNLAHGEPADGV